MILERVKSTEKIMRMMESSNSLVFETDRSTKKQEIKKEVEGLFNVKVDKINTHIRENKKLAYVKLKKEFPAIDIATKLKLI
jgi:large subunit ribosomal protein L23